MASIVLATALVAGATAAPAQDDEPEIQVFVNFVYAAQFGFGGYSVGDLDVTVYSLPIGTTFEDVLFDWDLRAAVPILYGRYALDANVTGAHIKARLHTLSAEPRLRLDIPLTKRWRISPIGAFGFGSSFSGSASVHAASGEVEEVDIEDTAFYTYQIGISSLIDYPWREFTFSLGNGFVYAGNADFGNDPGVQAYGTLRTGVDARHPLGFRVRNLEPDASVFFIHDYFTPSLEFSRIARSNLEVDNLFEFGLSFGSQTPWDIFWLSDQRIGVSYQFGGDLDAVRVNFGFPF